MVDSVLTLSTHRLWGAAEHRTRRLAAACGQRPGDARGYRRKSPVKGRVPVWIICLRITGESGSWLSPQWTDCGPAGMSPINAPITKSA